MLKETKHISIIDNPLWGKLSEYDQDNIMESFGYDHEVFDLKQDTKDPNKILVKQQVFWDVPETNDDYAAEDIIDGRYYYVEVDDEGDVIPVSCLAQYEFTDYTDKGPQYVWLPLEDRFRV